MKGSFLKVLIEFPWCFNFFFWFFRFFCFLSLLSFLFVKEDLFVTKSFCLVLIDAKSVLVWPWPQHASTARVHRLHCMSPWNVAIFSLPLVFFFFFFVCVCPSYPHSFILCPVSLCVYIIQNNHIHIYVFCTVPVVICIHVHLSSWIDHFF